MRYFVPLLAAAILLAIPATASADILRSSPRAIVNGQEQIYTLETELGWDGGFFLYNLIQWSRIDNTLSEGEYSRVTKFQGPEACSWSNQRVTNGYMFWWTTCQGAGWYVTDPARGSLSLRTGRWKLANGWHQLGANRKAYVADSQRFIAIYHNNSVCANC